MILTEAKCPVGIYSFVLKDGLRKYRYKNSKIRSFGKEKEGNKGAVFVFRSKEHLKQVPLPKMARASFFFVREQRRKKQKRKSNAQQNEM